MDKKIQAKLLYKFLKKRNVLSKYITNTCEFSRLEYPNKNDVIYFIEKRGCSHIYFAFRWLDTKEGYDFWRKLYIEFENYIDAYPLNVICVKY